MVSQNGAVIRLLGRLPCLESLVVTFAAEVVGMRGMQTPSPFFLLSVSNYAGRATVDTDQILWPFYSRGHIFKVLRCSCD